MKTHFYKLIFCTFLIMPFTAYGQNSNTKRVPPAGWHIGEKHPFQGRNKIEQNMLGQIMTYNSALLVGDVANAKRYVYQDAITYYKKFYPTVVPDEKVISDFFKMFSKDYVSAMNTYRKNGIDLRIIPCNIQRQVTNGNSIIIVFDIVSVMDDGNISIYSDPESTIGISLNNGTNWSFLTMMEEVPNILRMRFSQSIINEVMGY